MIVKSTWTRTITIVALVSSISADMLSEDITSTESSSEYLRKVMLELRDMKLRPSLPVPQRSTGSFYFDVDDKHYLAGKRHSSGQRIFQLNAINEDNSAYPAASMVRSATKKIQPVTADQVISGIAKNNIYYQVPAAVLPSPQKAPEVSALANAGLNAVYKHAIGQGSATGLNALANVLRHRQLPIVTPNHIEVGESPSQSVYTYYFHPMKSLMSDIHQENPLIPVMNLRPENTRIEDSQKEMGHPLFMAISGFIGMAVLFMIGVLLFPRLGDFHSRLTDDEKHLDLTRIVGEAIDRHNCTDKQVPHANLDERLRILCQPVKIPKSTLKRVLLRAAEMTAPDARASPAPPCGVENTFIGGTADEKISAAEGSKEEKKKFKNMQNHSVQKEYFKEWPNMRVIFFDIRYAYTNL